MTTRVTMTNNGRIGFNDYSSNQQGIGVLYPSSSVNHIFEGGLIVGTSTTKLVNNIHDDTQQSQDNDFLARTIYQLDSRLGFRSGRLCLVQRLDSARSEPDWDWRG